ncbi:hypothetical protein ACFQ14_11820 [Pseudahrensia aquimaris]|uniref:Capsule polysaccharide biosynthesis protein n=1 Tax=Pseudahrensia aquimaris TaxID=744461 RepID=A0ABW3FLQ9_9HYPH
MKFSDISQKATRKARRLYHQPDSWRDEMQFVRRWAKLEPGAEDYLQFMGRNWQHAPDKPVIFLWKINPWKRRHLVDYLPEYRVAFVRFDTGPQTVFDRRPDLFEGEWKLGIWGNDVPKSLSSFAEQYKKNLVRIEDGFLRSMGSGVKHTRAHSLVFDDNGLYYDALGKSDVQKLIAETDLSADPDLAKNARDGLLLMRAARLSKYYTYFSDEPVELEDAEGRERVLIVGQVENDASIRYGSLERPNLLQRLTNKNFSNQQLVETASDKFANAQLHFRPHPDVGSRQSKKIADALPSQSLIVHSPNAPLADLTSQMDRIFTQTSLSGFEALIQGKKVTVAGAPFYAGHGLTDDLQQIPERTGKDVSLETLFAAVYLRYPRYVHPVSNGLSNFFEVAGHFIVEQVKHLDPREIPENWLDLEKLRSIEETLPSAVRVLLYLNTCPDSASATVDQIMQRVDDATLLHNFAQIVDLLVGTFNYDALLAVTNRALDQLEANDEIILHDPMLTDSVLSAVTFAQANLNGRVCRDIPDLIDKLVESYSEEGGNASAIHSYARALSNNLHYNPLVDLMNALSSVEKTDPALYHRLCTIIRSNPTRSERDHSRRRGLQVRCAELLKEHLAAKYPSRYDMFLNAALVGVATDSVSETQKGYDLLIGSFANNEFNLQSKSIESWGHLAKRSGHFYQIFDFFVKRGQFEQAKKMLAEHFFHKSAKTTTDQKARLETAWIALHAAKADHLGVIKAYSTASPMTQKDSRAIMRYAKALRAIGEFAEAKRTLNLRLQNVVEPAKRKSLKDEIAKIDFIRQTSRILKSYPQPVVPKGVVFLASQSCFNTLAMMTPALYALKKKGYAVVNLLEGMVEHDPTGIEYIDRFAGSIPSTLYHHQLDHDWEINWDERTVEAEGINFYQGFYERMSTRVRKYEVDINEDAANRDFSVYLKRADTCLSVCEDIFREVVQRKINVVMVSGNAHVVPFSVFRDFARAKDDPHLSFINCNVAYESYFSNLGSKYASTMCVTDMTLHKDRRAPFMALPEKFETWYAQNRSDSDLKQRADDMIKVNRNSSSSNETELEIVDWLKSERAAGKKVVCAFGKVPVDLNVPYDGGPAHKDMKDWLNHTVQSVAGADDVILLIKPHPHELRPEIALDLIDFFADLIEVDIPDNVRVLGHRDINVHALAPHLDLALLWNGSSSLELTALGIPVLMASWFGKHDYPVDLIYPESRDQYRSYLRAGKFKKPSKELRNRSAFLISYLGTPDVSILNEYSLRQLTNDRVGVPQWRWEQVNDLLQNGDDRMDLVADRMIEKFTGISR